MHSSSQGNQCMGRTTASCLEERKAEPRNDPPGTRRWGGNPGGLDPNERVPSRSLRGFGSREDHKPHRIVSSPGLRRTQEAIPPSARTARTGSQPLRAFSRGRDRGSPPGDPARKTLQHHESQPRQSAGSAHLQVNVVVQFPGHVARLLQRRVHRHVVDPRIEHLAQRRAKERSESYFWAARGTVAEMRRKHMKADSPRMQVQ